LIGIYLLLGAWDLVLILKKDFRKMEEILLKVYLQPKSSKNEIMGPYRDGIKVKVTASPIEGKANEALIRFLAKEFGISPSCIEIIRGHHSREKTLRISGIALHEPLDFKKKTF
jgi:uncharacterized protein (TIGR00251 family)